MYSRAGTLSESCYKATLVDAERYLLTCYRCIELNPVRAGMVRTPGEYPWSSYHFNALGQHDGVIVPQSLYQRLGRAEDRSNLTPLTFDLDTGIDQ